MEALDIGARSEREAATAAIGAQAGERLMLRGEGVVDRAFAQVDELVTTADLLLPAARQADARPVPRR
jgi:hypothetical protein